MSLPTTSGDQIDQMLPVVAAVSNDSLRRRQALDQGWGSSLVRGMTGCEQQPDGQALLIDHSMDFGA